MHWIILFLGLMQSLLIKAWALAICLPLFYKHHPQNSKFEKNGSIKASHLIVNSQKYLVRELFMITQELVLMLLVFCKIIVHIDTTDSSRSTFINEKLLWEVSTTDDMVKFKSKLHLICIKQLQRLDYNLSLVALR